MFLAQRLETYPIIIENMHGTTNPATCILIRTESLEKYDDAIELKTNANNHLSNEDTTSFPLSISGYSLIVPP